MKLSKLYTNLPDLFEPVSFNTGLCVVLAEIRLPENRAKDTHNLGKSLLGRLIDFCLLAGKDKNFFLFKHEALFRPFIFFLELELLDGSFVTVRRGVLDATKIGFKRHPAGDQNFADLASAEWDHIDVPFVKAKELLDGILDLWAIRPWDYRKPLGYLLRSQDDYRDVFQLGKHKGAHADWKPFLAHLLGFNATLVAEHYEKEEELAKVAATARTVLEELGGSAENLSKVEGMLLLKQQEAEKKQVLLSAFDFRPEDADQTTRVVNDIDTKIAALNDERYTLNKNRKRIADALDQADIQFDPDEAERIFREANVHFGGQLKRDFEQLIAFNKAIGEERRKYLVEERKEIDARLREVNAELTTLGGQRTTTLSFLTETDVFAKYKRLTDEMVTLRADITGLERQRVHLHRLQELRTQTRSLTETRGQLQVQIERDAERQNADGTSRFSTIRVHFSEIVERVIDRKALLSVAPNKEGHLNFRADILDASGNKTSADDGHTYRKLLCMAFDLAVLRAYLGERFPRFVYHDGAFETLDDRKKENLLTVIREYAGLGIQSIITLIDSDLPRRPKGDSAVFEEDEIVLRLHDEGDSGRVFKMPSW